MHIIFYFLLAVLPNPYGIDRLSSYSKILPMWGGNREIELYLSEPSARYHKKIMKGGGDRERPHRKLGSNADKSPRPGKWEAAREEVAIHLSRTGPA